MVKNFKNRYIYDELKDFYNSNNGELYSYQDFEKSGLKEFNVAAHKIKDLKLYEKNRLADDFAKIFLNILYGKDNMNSLEGYLTLNPVVNYHENILKLFKGICEDENKKASIEELIVKILTKSNSSEVIKSALIIAPLVETQDIQQILKIYSIHNDYLFYVLNAYEFIGAKNTFFFDIAKKSRGYGRFFAVIHLKPVTYDVIEWMIEEGSSNNVAVSELIYLNMLSINILDYMNKTKFSKEKIEKLSKSFNIMLSDYGLNEVRDEIEVCTTILEEIHKYNGGIYSLYLTISILYSVEADLVEYYKENKIDLQMSLYDKYKDVISKCKLICNKVEWKKVIENEINNIEIESSVLITCAEKIGYKLKKKDLEIILKRDYCNPLLYKYAFLVGNKSIKRYAYDIAIKKLKISDIITGPEEFSLDKLTYENIEHICFFIITKYMNYEDFQDEYKEFNMKAIKSPLIETRLQAVKNLEKFKGKLTPEEKEYIRETIEVEMISSIKMGLSSIIIDNDEKEKKVINVDKFSEFVVHVKDIYITSVKISVNNKYNCSSLFKSIQEDDIVYLVRELDNGYDSSTVLVTTDKGVVIGKIPVYLEEILKNLIDKGKWFYGKIEDISDDYEEFSIGVILSYKDVLDEIGNTLMLLSTKGEEFIQ